MHAEDWGDGPDLSCCLNLYCAMHLTAAKRGPRGNGTTCGSHGTWCLGVWLTAHSGWPLVTALPMAWLIQHGVCVHGSHIVVPLTVCHTVPRRYVMHDACHMCVLCVWCVSRHHVWLTHDTVLSGMACAVVAHTACACDGGWMVCGSHGIRHGVLTISGQSSIVPNIESTLSTLR